MEQYAKLEEKKETVEEKQSSSEPADSESGDATEASQAAEKAKHLSQSVGNSLAYSLGWVWKKLMTPPHRTGVLGVNLGKNKLSNDEVAVSFIFLCCSLCYHHAQVSSTDSDVFHQINIPGLHTWNQRIRTIRRLPRNQRVFAQHTRPTLPPTSRSITKPYHLHTISPRHLCTACTTVCQTGTRSNRR